MRPVAADLYAYSLPYRRPVTWYASVEDAGLFLALRLLADDGSRGVAEATIKPTWSGVSPRSLAAALEDVLLPALSGVDVGDPAAVEAALAPFPENRLGKMLVDNACATLRATVDGVPLWRRLGGTPAVALSWCVTRQPPDAMAADAAAAVERHGFATLKVKGGQGPEADRAALRAIRRAVGDAVTCTVDANGFYAPDAAAGYVRMIADEGVAVAEDPCRLAPGPAFAALAGASPIPILVDSAVLDAASATAFVASGARAVSVKPGRVGITTAGAIRDVAVRGGASVCSGMYAESALGTLVSLQLSAALDAPLVAAEQSFYLTMTEQVLAAGLAVEAGAVRLPDAADLDSLVDWPRVASRATLHARVALAPVSRSDRAGPP